MYYLISIEQKCKCITCASYEEMEESKVCLEKDKQKNEMTFLKDYSCILNTTKYFYILGAIIHAF